MIIRKDIIETSQVVLNFGRTVYNILDLIKHVDYRFLILNICLQYEMGIVLWVSLCVFFHSIYCNAHIMSYYCIMCITKDAPKPSGKERTLLKQYEILTAGNLDKLIKRKTSDGECYVDTSRLGFISRTCSNNNATLTYIFFLWDSGQTLHLDQYPSNPMWYIKVILDSCNSLI